MPSISSEESSGFTLLEVMLALSIIAIALTAVLSLESQGISLASEAKFTTTAVFLAQSKMAEVEAQEPENLLSDSGDFGEDFPDYRWDMSVSDSMIAEPEGVSDYLKQIDLKIFLGEGELYQYSLRQYKFVPETG